MDGAAGGPGRAASAPLRAAPGRERHPRIPLAPLYFASSPVKDTTSEKQPEAGWASAAEAALFRCVPP